MAQGGQFVGKLTASEVTLIRVEDTLIRVEGQGASGKVAKTTADVDGFFRFEGVLPGSYFLFAECRGYVSTQSHVVRVSAGGVTLVDLLQRVGGEVLSAKDMMEVSGTVRSDQGPLGDATVNILLLPVAEKMQQLRTDRTGKYGPVRVTPGDQVVTVLKPGYEYKIKLVKRGTKRVVDFHLDLAPSWD